MFKAVSHSAEALLATVITLSATHVTAAPITYTDTGIGSGFLGGTAFTDAVITLTGTGDTTNVVPVGLQFLNLVSSLTIDIAGVGTATYNGVSSPFAFTNHTVGQVGGGFGGEIGFAFGTFSLAFAGYDLTTAFGPVSGPGVVQSSLLTTAGNFFCRLSATRLLPRRVESSATPLPAALPLFATGLGALGLRAGGGSGRRKHPPDQFRCGRETLGRNARGFLFTRMMLTMSAIGTKRTSACALHMSAFDPKRT